MSEKKHAGRRIRGREVLGRVLSCVAVASAGVAFAGTDGETMVPSFSFFTNSVPAGETETLSGKLRASPEAELIKTGGGTWTIPFSSFAQPWGAAFTVREGTLAFDSAGSGEESATASDFPESLLNKALLWVDASDPVGSHIVAENGRMSEWYDRRENDVSSPSYCRARTYTGYTNEAPTLVKYGGAADAVYFGGFGSGQAMEFVLPSGSRFAAYTSAAGVRHVFAVHAVSNSYGTIFGSYSGQHISPFIKDTSNDKYYWKSDDTWSAMSNGRTYLNGERIDGTMTKRRDGLQLLEGERFYNRGGIVNGFFANSGRSGSGGDYLCEALVFTNALTESERLIVTDYLMAKWLPDVTGRVLAVDVKSGATLAVGSADLDGSKGSILASGNGTVAVSGTDGFIVQNDDSKVFDGTLSLDGGTATLRSPMAVALPASGRVTVENTESGPETTVYSGDGDELTKDGNDVLTVRSLPQTLRRVEVEEGALSVRAANPANIRDEYEQIPVFDGGFEEYAKKIATYSEGVGSLTSPGTTDGGWSHRSGNSYVIDWWRWTGKGIDGATRSAWKFDSPPPEGKCALVLRALSSDTMVWSKDFALDAGLYELRFYMCGRQDESYLGKRLTSRLVDVDGKVKAEFGDVVYTDYTGYKEIRLRTTVGESGSFRFSFSVYKGVDGPVLIDDVRLFKVTPSRLTASEWKIPGGDFETDTLPEGSGIKRFSVEHTLENWSFIQSSNWSEGKRADVGITTIATTNSGAYGTGVLYNDSRRPATGAMQLCMVSNGCSAVTRFTPPAGRWQLQGCLAHIGSHGYTPKASAVVKIGDDVHDLGTISVKTRLMKRFAWPVSFSVNGTQEVELTLTVSGIQRNTGSFLNGMLFDDLVLAGATGLDLMRGGDCESLNGNSPLKSQTASVYGYPTGKCRVRPPSESYEAFGTRVIKGYSMITIENTSAIYEDVYIPFPGRYRLSFYSHSRLTNKGGSTGPNPVRAWIAADGVTNVVGHADMYNSEWVQRVFDFNVPSAGVWRVTIQGCDTPYYTTHCHEAQVDAITLHQIPDLPDAPPPFPEECRIAVAEGARLEVDFDGTNVVRGLKLGGVGMKGIVDVSDHPEYLLGRGTFRIVPYGTCITVR